MSDAGPNHRTQRSLAGIIGSSLVTQDKLLRAHGVPEQHRYGVTFDQYWPYTDTASVGLVPEGMADGGGQQGTSGLSLLVARRHPAQ